MGEVKIYRGTVNGVTRMGFTVLSSFFFPVEESYRVVPLSSIFDLTEMESFPKGEGIYIKGYEDTELWELFRCGERLTKAVGEHYRLNQFRDLIEQTGITFEPQLSDTKATEEQVSLGEGRTPFPCKLCVDKFFTEQRFLDAHIWSVHTELPRPDLSRIPEFEGYIGQMGDEGLIAFWKEIKSSILKPIRHVFFPPVELPEPKETVKPTIRAEVNDIADVWYEADFVPVQYGDRTAWINSENAQPYRWNELRNPRVIGGEK